MRTINDRIKDAINELHKLEGTNIPSFSRILDGIIWELIKIKALKEKEINDENYWHNRRSNNTSWPHKNNLNTD